MAEPFPGRTPDPGSDPTHGDAAAAVSGALSERLLPNLNVDEQCLYGGQHGEAKLARLVRELSDVGLRAARRSLRSPKEAEEAEDVVCKACNKLLMLKEQLRAPVRAFFLDPLVKNAVRDEIRHRTSERGRFMATVDGLNDLRPSDLAGSRTGYDADAEDLARSVWLWIDDQIRSGDRQLLVFSLHLRGERTLSQIAAQHEKPYSTIKSQYARAQQKIRERFSSQAGKE